MKSVIKLLVFVLFASAVQAQSGFVSLSKEELKNKIMGGWAGQTIGVTFGGPYEFRFQGTFIGDYQPLKWYNGYLKDAMINNPGLYDDLYMDLTFVDVFEKYGLQAPVDSFANAFAHAGYALWHANQAARYNLLNGIKAPQSGFWKSNPHADCIDYQIESDFAGLMSPAMPNTASAISDKIGHIMNYGDGWYGGVYVGAMYSLAFVSSDINYIVTEALKTIPAQSEFYKCMQDVIALHKKYPADWKATWLEIQRKWANDIGCPDGVFAPFNIDAKVNAAYVIIGLLYGNGDFTKTLEIATRCGQDADCNPSSAGGILGAIVGYNKIPDYWKMGLHEAEDIDFKYTTMSLNNVYATGYKHAIQNIENNGGKQTETSVLIKLQKPVAVAFEKSFPSLYPVAKITPQVNQANNEISFSFEGTGFVLRGETAQWASTNSFAFNTALYIDDKLVEQPALPSSFTTRRHELCWNYDLPNAKHTVVFKILNRTGADYFKTDDVIIYANAPIDGMQQNMRAAKQ
jgi:hypothetical protein